MRTITPDDLFSFRLDGGIQVSPNENLIVYVESQAQKKENNYKRQLMAVRPGEEPFAFTAGPSDTHPAFSPDGLWIAFLSERSGQSQIWIMATHGGEAQQLSKIEGGITEFVWAPDGHSLFAIAKLTESGIQLESTHSDDDHEDPRIKFNRDVKVITELSHKMDGVGYYDEKRPHVVHVYLDPEKSPEQLTFGPYRHGSLAIDASGTKIAVLSRYGDDYDRDWPQGVLYLLDLTEGPNPAPQALTDDTWSVDSPAFTLDGGDIVFVAEKKEDWGYDTPNLYSYRLSTGEMHAIAHDWDRPIGNLALSDMIGSGSNPFCFTSDGSSLFTLSSFAGATQLITVDLTANTVTQLTQDDCVYYSYHLNAGQTHAALVKSTPENPSQITWLDLKTGNETLLVNPNQALLSQCQISSPKRFQYRAPGGPAIDGWVMKPADYVPGRTYPAVLEIHGGPMMLYAQSFFFEFQWLAANGYGVIYTNPRGSQGYGTDFCKAIQKEWGNLDYADIMAGLDTALTDNPWIDATRLGVAGGSYGGYMTNWILGHSQRFAAAVTMRSVVDWRAMVGTGDGGWHWMLRAGGTPPWQDDTWYRQQSPITYVDNFNTPLLIEHQEGDLRCPIEQGEMLYTAVKYLNRAPVKFVRYPGEFHGMSRDGKPWHRVHRLESMSDWLNTYLIPTVD